jgi:hypothetical protein
MARRRYLSSAISTDKLVNRLALEAGDFAALLYTWMIPHAADNATLTGDPEELLMQVFPGRRDKQPEDVAHALAAMVELGLITWESCGCVRFPSSFYKHQTYISADRREVAETAQIAADQRRSAQTASSFKSSFSSKSSLKLKVNDPDGSNIYMPEKQKKATPISADFEVTDEMTNWALAKASRLKRSTSRPNASKTTRVQRAGNRLTGSGRG